MKKLLILIFPLLLWTSCKKKDSTYYKNRLEKLAKYVSDSYSGKVEEPSRYRQNNENGKIFRLSDEGSYEYDKYCFLDFVREKGKIVYVSKLIYLNDKGLKTYEYFFDDEKLIGMRKLYQIPTTSVCAEKINYRKSYALNMKTNKFEFIVDRSYNQKGDDIEMKSECKKYREKLKMRMDDDNTEEMTNFRDLQGFLETEKIKYYK